MQLLYCPDRLLHLKLGQAGLLDNRFLYLSHHQVEKTDLAGGEKNILLEPIFPSCFC